MRAHCLLRQEPWYRRDAFAQGLAAAGHTVSFDIPTKFDADTLLVTWNRYFGTHDLACRVEEAGGKVLVAENGYLGRGGSVPKWDVHPHGPSDDDYYALAIGGHNGSGSWPDDAPRWDALDVELKPWRTAGQHVLICPSRPFGRPDMSMPADWPQRIVERLREVTDRELRVRRHPGNDAPKRPLCEDLEGACAMVIWASSCGVHSLIAGIPVISDAPHWICRGATVFMEELENPPLSDETRLQAMRQLAAAQFTIREIRSGEPFKRLLDGRDHASTELRTAIEAADADSAGVARQTQRSYSRG